MRTRPDGLTMPKEGFKSITVSETVFQRFNEAYNASKEMLAARGIRSVSGYIGHMLSERMRESDVVEAHPPRIRKISADDDRVVLMDSKLNRVAEVAVRDGALFCQLCKTDKCLHVGFAYALPEVYATLDMQAVMKPA